MALEANHRITSAFGDGLPWSARPLDADIAHTSYFWRVWVDRQATAGIWYHTNSEQEALFRSSDIKESNPGRLKEICRRIQYFHQ